MIDHPTSDLPISDLYQQLIQEAASHPHNKQPLSEASLQAKAINASCGDELQVWLKVDDQSGIVTEVGWTGEGCIISQAAMSELSMHIKGMTTVEITQLSQADVLNMLNLPQISTGRIKCLMLGLEAVKKAIGTRV